MGPTDSDPIIVEPAEANQAIDVTDALPVVARLVVEIRSDGTTTVARGAVEDLVGGERVAMEASAGSPVELAGALVKMLMQTPLLATRALRGGAGPEEPGGPSRVRRLAGSVAQRLLARAGRRRPNKG